MTINRDMYAEFLSNIWLDIYEIKNCNLFVQSLTHKSYAADFSTDVAHNERLEFAGDAILGSIVATLLFINHPGKSEADMTLYKIALVREEMLATVARNIGIDRVVLISNGEERSSWRQKDAILSDTLEAFIAYLAIDAWYTTAYDFVNRYVYSQIDTLSSLSVVSYKTQIQERSQKKYQQLPIYTDSIHEQSETGNVIVYCAKIQINGKDIASGYGPSKKKAQEDAAKNALEQLTAWQEQANN